MNTNFRAEGDFCVGPRGMIAEVEMPLSTNEKTLL